MNGNYSLGLKAVMLSVFSACLLAACGNGFSSPVSQDANLDQTVDQPSRLENRPNVVVIITDDQGYKDVGFNGSKDIPTPNIDRIAKEGVRFTRGYVTYPVCGPSRAGLLTGRYQSRFGFDRNPDMNPGNINSGIPLSEETMAEILAKADYTSMIVGKWHMGTHPKLRPLERGFDEFYGFIEGGHRYFPEDITINDIGEVTRPGQWYKARLRLNDGFHDLEQYLTDELSDRAVDFVERNSDKPFFLYLAYNAPHTPLQATQKYLDRFPHIEDENRRTYAAMISSVDDGVGRVLDVLEDKGVADNTLVVFLSDNGGIAKTKRGRVPFADNTPLRGGKSDLYDGGVRVPFAMRWPDKIRAGQDYDNPIISLDILATLTSQIGIPVSQERPLDGVDLIPYLQNEKSGMPHETLYWRKFDAGFGALVHGDLKLVDGKNGIEVFNIKEDVGESRNLAENKKLVEGLIGIHAVWNDDMALEPAVPPLGTWPPSNDGKAQGKKNKFKKKNNFKKNNEN